MATTRNVQQAGKASERVAILLATRNGELFLDEQLASLARQTHPLIDIWASDDGSTDRTSAILSDWQARWDKGAFHIAAGPCRGFAENFRSLILNEAIDADYMAFCDQDDIWEAGKLETALASIHDDGMVKPVLFCGRTLNVSSGGEAIGLSPFFRRQPSFRNALVQSIAGGNTMVLNRAAWQSLRQASEGTGFVSHDWWAYQVVTGVGGTVRYTAQPQVRYRQHAANLIGANTSWAARLTRVSFLMEGGFRNWNDINMRGLQHNRDMLTPDALKALDLFEAARKGGFVSRLANLWRSGVYRQTRKGTIALWLACAMARI
ncbi:MAG: glycosyltransferase family 2 protein [Rhizobiaceae bacterium]|nr:glycosyltransferase family 2 protein [Rhizobiaceae bacterium]